MKNKAKEYYYAPIITAEKLLFENDLAQSSGGIQPGDQSGTVRIYDWEALDNDNDLIISESENSSWQ